MTFLKTGLKKKPGRLQCCGPSQHCKVLSKLLEKLLSVDVFWESVLRFLSCTVAALKVPKLDTDKKM